MLWNWPELREGLWFEGPKGLGLGFGSLKQLGLRNFRLGLGLAKATGRSRTRHLVKKESLFSMKYCIISQNLKVLRALMWASPFFETGNITVFFKFSHGKKTIKEQR